MVCRVLVLLEHPNPDTDSEPDPKPDPDPDPASEPWISLWASRMRGGEAMVGEGSTCHGVGMVYRRRESVVCVKHCAYGPVKI